MQRTTSYFPALVMILVSIISCQSQDTAENFRGYLINSPSERFELPGKLTEVSGLSAYKENTIAMVQDEDDIAFIYDPKIGSIVDKVQFHKDGDHEGIAFDGQSLYVARSDGDLFRLKDLKGKKTDSKHYKTDLKTKNDIEGLCYDHLTRQFMIACKGDPGAGLNGARYRTVWGFDEEENKLSDKPLFRIDIKEINKVLRKKYNRKWDRSFAPSAIEIHPNGQEIWLLAAQGNLIIAINRKGTVLDAAILGQGLFTQPEGLTFGDDEVLYISNEGHGEEPTLLRFEPLQQ